MKVIHFSSATTWRGGEQQIVYLVEELDKAGIEQWIFCPTNSALAEYCLFHNLPHFTYHKLFSTNPLVAFQFNRICQQLAIDIAHIHDAHSHTYAYMSAVMGNQTFLVLSRRVDFPIRSNWLSKKKYNHPAIKRILCISEKVKEVLKPDIVDTTKLEVVYSGIDLSKFLVGKEARLRKELDLLPTTKIIANIAAIAPHKDYFTFIDTAALIKKKHPDTLFLIIGSDGGEKKAMEDYLVKKNLKDTVRLLGFRNDIPLILPEIDVLLFTSKEEGLGTTILDALACGVPVVATNAGGIPEIIQDQQHGLLASIGDAEQLAANVAILLFQPKLAEQYIAAGQKRVKAFSKEITAQKTLASYKGVINSTKITSQNG